MDDTETGSAMDEDRESAVAEHSPESVPEPVAPGAADAPESTEDAAETERESESEGAPGAETEAEPPLASAASADEAAPAEQAQLELPVEDEAEAEVASGEGEGAEEAAPKAVAPEPTNETEPGDLTSEPTPTIEELVAELAAESPEGVEPTEGAGEESEAGEGVTSESEGGEEAEAAAEAEATEPEPEAEEEVELPVARRLWTRIPFWVLGLLWVAFAGGLTYLLWPTSSGVFVTSPLYAYLVFGGAALVFIGLVLGLVIWLSARSAAGPDGRSGIAGAVWMRAMGWTAAGVALWWIALTVLDLHRTGVIH